MAFSDGSILGYNDVLHNETTIGAQSTLLAADANLASGPSNSSRRT